MVFIIMFMSIISASTSKLRVTFSMENSVSRRKHGLAVKPRDLQYDFPVKNCQRLPIASLSATDTACICCQELYLSYSGSHSNLAAYALPSQWVGVMYTNEVDDVS